MLRRSSSTTFLSCVVVAPCLARRCLGRLDTFLRCAVLRGKLSPKKQKEFEKLEQEKAEVLLKLLKETLERLKKSVGHWQEKIKATREGTVAQGGITHPKTSHGFDADVDKFVALPCRHLKHITHENSR